MRPYKVVGAQDDVKYKQSTNQQRDYVETLPGADDGERLESEGEPVVRERLDLLTQL